MKRNWKIMVEADWWDKNHGVYSPSILVYFYGTKEEANKAAEAEKDAIGRDCWPEEDM